MFAGVVVALIYATFGLLIFHGSPVQLERIDVEQLND